MTIAIVATVYNEILNIHQFIESILSQNITPHRIVIVDGGSTDGTADYLKECASKVEYMVFVQDLTCSLSYSKGPIARGRNVAINKCDTSYIITADAGCVYPVNWLASFQRSFKSGCKVVSGGTCLSSDKYTCWDVASAPFLGFDLPSINNSARPSGTCRALGFERKAWEEVGGFSEDALTGEDTDFFLKIKRNYKVCDSKGAAAVYSPQYNFSRSIMRLYRYAKGDGVYQNTRLRCLRMLMRIIAGILAVISLSYNLLPFIVWVVVELFFAFRYDLTGILKLNSTSYMFCRFFFSLFVPLVYVAGYVTSYFDDRIINDQNLN